MIEKGVNINALNNDKWTPLHFAARYNNSTDAVKILIEKGSNINAIDNYKQLHCIWQQDITIMLRL